MGIWWRSGGDGDGVLGEDLGKDMGGVLGRDVGDGWLCWDVGDCGSDVGGIYIYIYIYIYISHI